MTDENAEQSAIEDPRPQSSDAPPADPAIEKRARNMGWIPESEWDDSSMKHRPKKFLPPEDYIETVEARVPIMREKLRHYDDVVQKQDKKLSDMTGQLTTAAQRLEDLGHLVESLHEQNQTIGKRAFEAARRDLEIVKRRAVSEADTDTYEEADRRLVELDKHYAEQQPKPKRGEEPAGRRTEERPTDKSQQEPPKISRTAKSWLDDNQTLMTDPVTNAIAVALHSQDISGGMSEEESFRTLTDRIRKEVPHKFPKDRREDPPSVAGSSPPPRSSKKQDFGTLPADAKKAYESLSRYFAAKGKTYTQEQYAKEYYVELERGHP